jgi:putative transposase
MNNKKINLDNYYFNQFKQEAIGGLKSGGSLTGKNDIFTPLRKEILEVALEGEMDAHYLNAEIKIKPIVTMASFKRP